MFQVGVGETSLPKCVFGKKRNNLFVCSKEHEEEMVPVIETCGICLSYGTSIVYLRDYLFVLPGILRGGTRARR